MTTTAQTAAPAVPMQDRISEEVRVLLARRRLPALALAPVLHLSQQTVSARLRGTKPWTVADLDALAAYFGVDANALLPGLGRSGGTSDPGRGRAATGLPHVDSNHEPAGVGDPQVAGMIGRQRRRRLVLVADGRRPGGRERPVAQREPLARMAQG